MSETRAYVAGGAQVNTAGSTSTDQEVRIVAAHDHSYVAVSGSLTGFGVFDVTPAASIGLIRNTTEAFVKRGASRRRRTSRSRPGRPRT